MTSENRERFLRLNPARTEKAVKAILTLAQTANGAVIRILPGTLPAPAESGNDGPQPEDW